MGIPSKILLSLILFLISLQLKAQTLNTFCSNIISNSSFDSIQKNIVDFVGFGVKEVGTAANTNTLNWLIDKYQSYGYTDIKIDTFSYASQFAYNLIVTKTGSLYPNRYVVIDGHYDTKTGVGANDNGSGTSIIIETARLLKNVDTEFSIKFIHFSAEEVGLVGSSHYVNNTVVPQNLDLKVVLNIDEVGGVSSLTNNTIVCERDENNIPSTNNIASANYTDTLATCIELYSNLNTEISYAYASDYMPFQSAGKVITGLFEKNESPYRHTANDIIANMDVNYVFEVGKGTIGATLYFAVAKNTNTSIANVENKPFLIYPNPTKNYFNVDLKKNFSGYIDLKIVNILGETVYQTILKQPKNQISINDMKSGIYSVILENNHSTYFHKIVVE